jgi:hypothetical protein
VRALVGAAILGAALLGCTKPRSEPPEASAARAKAVLVPFQTELKAALENAIAAGGAEPAIEACSSVAPALAAKASTGGMTVGRASAKLRNPKNAAPSWVGPAMAELAAAKKEGDYRVVPLPGGKVGYAETILVKPKCLLCHGDKVSPGVAAKLADKYPNDAARGYSEGEFRGVSWVELPPP